MTPQTVSASFFLSEGVSLNENESLRLRMDHASGFGDHNIGQFRVFLSNSDHIESAAFNPKVLAALKTAPEKRSKAELKTLTDFYRTLDAPTKEADQAVAAAEKKLNESGAENGARDGHAGARRRTPPRIPAGSRSV